MKSAITQIVEQVSAIAGVDSFPTAIDRIEIYAGDGAEPAAHVYFCDLSFNGGLPVTATCAAELDALREHLQMGLTAASWAHEALTQGAA